MVAVVNRPLVLFICTANSARSQMGEAILRAKAGDRFEVASAGLDAKEINPLTIRVLEEAGYPTRDLYAKSLSQFLAKESVRFAIIVCENAADRCPSVYPFAGRTLRWPFDDPAAHNGDEQQRIEKFREVRDQIAARLDRWLAGE